MDAITILCNGLLNAAVEIADGKGFLKSLDSAKLSDAMKQTMYDNLDTVRAEWREALDAHMGEPMLRTIMNAQAYDLAIKSLKLAGYM